MPGAPASPRRASLKARALQLLSRRDYSRAELRRKLLPAALAEAIGGAAEADLDDEQARQRAGEQIDALLDWLQAQRHQSDSRFVESRVHARTGRFGNQRIRRELALHEVELTPEMESDLKRSELERALDVLGRKFACAAASPNERSRQARFLAGRGFGAEVIQRALRASANSAEEAGPEFD